MLLTLQFYNVGYNHNLLPVLICLLATPQTDEDGLTLHHKLPTPFKDKNYISNGFENPLLNCILNSFLIVTLYLFFQMSMKKQRKLIIAESSLLGGSTHNKRLKIGRRCCPQNFPRFIEGRTGCHNIIKKKNSLSFYKEL